VVVGDTAGPPVLSPDGKNLAFLAAEAGGARRLYVRPLGSLDARALSGTDNASAPFWSPDGRRLGFFAEGKLRVIDIQGGGPVSLTDAPNARGGSWSPDGTIVFAPDSRGILYGIPATGGNAAVAVTRLDQSRHTSHRWPWFLPDGKHFLYLAINHQAPRDENAGIYFASLDGKQNVRLRTAFTNPQYAAGFLLYVRDGGLVAQAFDPSSGKLQDEVQQVASDVTEDGSTWRAAFTVSRNGLLAYASGAHAEDTQVAWYDRGGKQVGTVGERFGSLLGAPGAQLRLSPTGDRAALAIQSSTGDIWVMDVRGVRTRLTFGPTFNGNPVWSPDGKSIAYRTRTAREGYYAIARRPAAGGPEETLLAGKEPMAPADWSADGKYLLYMKPAGGTRFEIWALSLGDHKVFQVTPSGAYTSESPRFSPDARWVAYWSDESGRRDVYVVPFHGAGKWEISTNGGTYPVWRSDGKELFFLSLSWMLTAVPIGEEGGQLKLGEQQPLFPTVSPFYDVAPGGQKFLSILVGDQGSKPVTLVTDWTAELKK
jgi:Tol biopolymer transport system component